jgi:DNA-binding response OmpR family regulator
MISQQILCVSHDTLSTPSWHKYIKQNIPNIVEVSANEALAAGSLDAYHLILVDTVINMEAPAQEVIDLCSQLRQRFSSPLLVTLSKTDDEYLLQLYDAGVDECIARSIAAVLLEAKIKSWLRWTRGHNTSETIQRM